MYSLIIFCYYCIFFRLFKVLDHVARHIHHKTLRSRGHLRAYVRLSALASIPFQLVSLCKHKSLYLKTRFIIELLHSITGTVLLAIFITVYTQQDKADIQPYCDENSLISPKNGIAVLLVIEFICVTILSLLYACEFKI